MPSSLALPGSSILRVIYSIDRKPRRPFPHRRSYCRQRRAAVAAQPPDAFCVNRHRGEFLDFIRTTVDML